MGLMSGPRVAPRRRADQLGAPALPQGSRLLPPPVSLMLATMRSFPPQRAQPAISIPNTLLSRRAQFMATCRGVGGCCCTSADGGCSCDADKFMAQAGREHSKRFDVTARPSGNLDYWDGEP